ncbi:MAG: ATP-binding protein [Rhodococcus sp. (in: high G+C Gram-positive bacteria)]
MVALSPSTKEAVAPTEVEGSAAGKILTMFGRFIGAGYFFYFLVSIPLIADLDAVTYSWWTPVALVVFFGPGFVLGMASFSRRGRTHLRLLAASCAISFLVGLLTWPLGWTGEQLPDGKSTWFALFPALASLGAAVSAKPRWAFLHLAVSIIACQVFNQWVREVGDRTPLTADIVYGFGFSLIFVAASITASRTGFLLDRTRLSTYAQAAKAAAVQARTVERRRFDGLIHDNVMSTLLAAARGPMDGRLVEQAQVALRELDALRSEGLSTLDFGPREVVAHLRASAESADPAVRLACTVDPDAAQSSIPAETVRTVGAAMAEAVRNSMRHAGSEAGRAVDVSMSRAELRVVVADDGRGFDLAAVPAHRLGVRVSIVDRMQRLPGGSARVSTSLGGGTSVDLCWVAEVPA